MYFDKTLTNCTNSRALYAELKRYGLNVTDMGREVYVYGEIEAKQYDTIIRICAEYGDIED